MIFFLIWITIIANVKKKSVIQQLWSLTFKKTMTYPLLNSSYKTSPGQGTNWSAPEGDRLHPCRDPESLPSAHSDKPQTHGTAAVNLMMISGVFGSPRIVPNRNNGKWKSSRILHLFAINYRCPFQTLYEGPGWEWQLSVKWALHNKTDRLVSLTGDCFEEEPSTNWFVR